MIERLEEAKKWDRISGAAVRPLRIRLSQLKRQWVIENTITIP
jgi:hypothetical protein